jgi:hypothetical protein
MDDGRTLRNCHRILLFYCRRESGSTLQKNLLIISTEKQSLQLQLPLIILVNVCSGDITIAVNRIKGCTIVNIVNSG